MSGGEGAVNASRAAARCETGLPKVCGAARGGHVLPYLKAKNGPPGTTPLGKSPRHTNYIGGRVGPNSLNCRPSPGVSPPLLQQEESGGALLAAGRGRRQGAAAAGRQACRGLQEARGPLLGPQEVPGGGPPAATGGRRHALLAAWQAFTKRAGKWRGREAADFSSWEKKRPRGAEAAREGGKVG